MKIIKMMLIVMLGLLFVGCSSDARLQEVGLDNMTGKEILEGVADGSIEVDGFGISVYDDELVVIIDSERIGVDMPKHEFYLSVAPYLTFTHECLFHSATGCRGELKQEEFFVEFVDEDGEIILSESMMSLSNGFIDLWLPRNTIGTLTISQNGLSASKQISTYPGEGTCETTMQLS